MFYEEIAVVHNKAMHYEILKKPVQCAVRMRFLFFAPLLILSIACESDIKIVTVSSVDFWTDTKINVMAGQTISIKASGEVFGHYNPPERIWGPLTPDGQTDEIADSLWMLPGVPKIALIAKIGEDGTPIKIGKAAILSADRDGRLFLGVNDRIYLHPSDHHYAEGDTRHMHQGCYTDNRGEFLARITIHGF